MAASAAAAGALAAPAVGRAQSSQVLRFIPQADLAVLDPVWTTAYVTRNHGYLVFDTLYGQAGPEGGFVASPQMLAGHSVEDDGRTWRLVLRDGLLFHDGEPVLARDCVASIRRWGARDSLGQTLLGRTDELSAPDDKTIRFRLKRPFPLLPYALGKIGSNMCAIMPERLAATDPFKQVSEMVGSGPFRFLADERVSGSRVAYERFRGYRPREGDRPPESTAGPKVARFERVEWNVIPDPATAAAALQAGEADGWELPPGDLLPMLTRHRTLKLDLVYDMGSAMLLRPNQLYPPFDNPAVRRALLGVVDQTEVMIAVVGTDPALRRVPCGFFPPGSPMASDAGMASLAMGKPDYGRAKRELRAAGYKGEAVAFMVPQDYPTLKAASDVAADMMKRAGMTVDYQAMDWGTLVQRRASKKPPAQGGWNAFCTDASGDDLATPATDLPLRGDGGRAWAGWPTSPRIEALRDEWLDAPDLAARKRIAAEIQAQAFEDVPYLPLGLFYGPSAYRADLTGILRGFPIFWNVRRQA